MADPLVVEVVRATGLPLRGDSDEKRRSPYLKLHLEPAWCLRRAAAEAPALARPTTTETWDEDGGHGEASPAPSREAGADDGAPTPKASRWSRAKALGSKASKAASRLGKQVSNRLDEARQKYEEATPAAPPEGSTPEKGVSVRPNALAPTWLAYVRVCEAAGDDDVLCVRVFDATVLTLSHYLGEARVRVGDLGAEATPWRVELSHAKHRLAGGAACEVWLRRVRLPAARGKRSVGCLLLRHGESCWNEAQASSDYAAMVLNRDHALTPGGVRQAARLNATWKHAHDVRAGNG